MPLTVHIPDIAPISNKITIAEPTFPILSLKDFSMAVHLVLYTNSAMAQQIDVAKSRAI